MSWAGGKVLSNSSAGNQCHGSERGCNGLIWAMGSCLTQSRIAMQLGHLLSLNGSGGSLAGNPLDAPPERFQFCFGASPTLPFVAGEGGAARCEAAGPEKPEVYSPEYIEDFFGLRTTQMAADRSSQWKDQCRTGS